MLNTYEFKARPKQFFPTGDWRIWLLISGRGFGKSFVGSNWVIHKAMTQKYPIALIGSNAADTRDYMVEQGESSIIKQCPKWFIPQYQASKRRLLFPNGVVAILYSAEDPDQLRGFNGNSAWCDELAKYQYPDETWDNLQFALRLGNHPQIVVTTTPRPIKLIKQLWSDSAVIKTIGSTAENRSNLAQSFVEYVYNKYSGTRLGRQELEGEILMDVPGALWSYSNLDQYRVSKAPELKQIVVAIDPAVTAEEDSNETGIVVCGIDENDHGYTLEDCSGIYHPNEWALKAIHLYEKYQANYIIAEVNQGGDLVLNNIRQVAKSLKKPYIPIKGVRATKGKFTRAEPSATLYEQGKIHHVSNFATLEDQLCTWLPGEDSPDRLDALVWAYTHLMIKYQDSTESESPW
ncbi:MAG: ATP-binding protein [Neisseriaceae bacterium]|nr:MAG: ATP-binding protein [Neisseriaceae bacterium]